MTQEEMLSLSGAMRQKYEQYRIDTPTKYPTLKFNSYPAPYEHLQEAMKSELSRQGGSQAKQAIANIPSTRILAKIFYEGYLLKEEKLLDSCYLFAWGITRHAFHHSTKEFQNDQPISTVASKQISAKRLISELLFSGLLLLFGLYLVTRGQPIATAPDRLVIKQPFNGQTVPMKPIIEGTVMNTDTVWPVVCDIRDTIYHAPAYYVQVPILVQPETNIWKGEVHVGGPNKQHIGAKVLIRTFVNPKIPLTAGERLYDWPRAELASAGINVIRGYYASDFASELVILQPLTQAQVGMKVLVSGKVINADIVWTIVHDLLSGSYVVQSPCKVEKNGTWRGPVYFGGLGRTAANTHYLLRAFVNPYQTLEEGAEIKAWPEAELSSTSIEVTRNSKAEMIHR